MGIERYIWVFILIIFLTGDCSEQKSYVFDDWNVEINKQDETLDFYHARLDKVIGDVLIFLEDGSKRIPLKNWSIVKRNNTLQCRTSKPEASWMIEISEIGRASCRERV